MAYPYDDENQDPNQAPPAATGTVVPVPSQPAQMPQAPTVQAAPAPAAPKRPAPRGTGFVGFEQFFGANRESANKAAAGQAADIRNQVAGIKDKATQAITDFNKNVAGGVNQATIAHVDPTDPWSAYKATAGAYTGPQTLALDSGGLKAAQDTQGLQAKGARTGGLDELLAGRAGGAERANVGRELADLTSWFESQGVQGEQAVKAAQAQVEEGNKSATDRAEELTKGLPAEKAAQEAIYAPVREQAAADQARTDRMNTIQSLVDSGYKDYYRDSDIKDVVEKASPEDLAAWNKYFKNRGGVFNIPKRERLRRFEQYLRDKYNGGHNVTWRE